MRWIMEPRKGPGRSEDLGKWRAENTWLLRNVWQYRRKIKRVCYLGAKGNDKAEGVRL